MLVLAACNSDEDTSKPADEPDKTEDGEGKRRGRCRGRCEEPASDDLFSVVLTMKAMLLKEELYKCTCK